MAVRRASLADLDAVVEMHHASFMAGNGPHLPAEQRDDFTLERSRSGWEPVLREVPDRASVMVLEEEGRLQGVAGAGPVRDDDKDPATVGELYALYVHPDAWGSGRGSILLAAALEHLGAQGFEEAILWVVEGNERARHFYERRHWKPDGSRRDFAGTPTVRLRVGLYESSGPGCSPAA